MTEQTFIETQVKWKWNMAIAIKRSTLTGHHKIIGDIIPLSLWSGIIAKTRKCVLTGLPGGRMLVIVFYIKVVILFFKRCDMHPHPNCTNGEDERDCYEEYIERKFVSPSGIFTATVIGFSIQLVFYSGPISPSVFWIGGPKQNARSLFHLFLM